MWTLILLFNLILGPTIALSPGQLGVHLDRSLATGPSKKIVFGSIVHIEGMRNWNDQQIVDMAYVAHGEMRDRWKEVDWDNDVTGFAKHSRPPTVTTTMVVDDTAYISSSMQGGAYLYLPKANPGPAEPRFEDFDPRRPCGQVMETALKNCQALSNGGGHRTGARCGEPMAMFAFCATNAVQNLVGARIVTIKGNNMQTPFDIVPPCGNPNGQLVNGAVTTLRPREA